MSKLTKNELKSIVKECLVEILAEGLVPGQSPAQKKRKNLSETLSSYGRKKPQSGIKKRISYLDNIKYNNQDEADRSGDINEQKINKMVASTGQKLSQDPIMRDILADTAKNTLQEQISADSKKSFVAPIKNADAAAQVVSENDPTDLFGDSSKNWATLAFS